MKTLEIDEYCEVAALKASGCELVECRPGRRVVFVFSDDDGKASQTSRQHVNGKLLVSSLVYGNALTWTRNKIFSMRGTVYLQNESKSKVSEDDCEDGDKRNPNGGA